MSVLSKIKLPVTVAQSQSAYFRHISARIIPLVFSLAISTLAVALTLIAFSQTVMFPGGRDCGNCGVLWAVCGVVFVVHTHTHSHTHTHNQCQLL